MQLLDLFIKFCHWSLTKQETNKVTEMGKPQLWQSILFFLFW